ncbi:hypothetical protein GJAV_G00131380 [Gymnothorax javanicus]|nr:hypothetical protein GJAV_G00131380 [Gymnothorax javanicus]
MDRDSPICKDLHLKMVEQFQKNVPQCPLWCFLDELDTLLRALPEDGTPLMVLGDFNLAPTSTQLSSTTSLLLSFALTQSSTPATHKQAHPHPAHG